jgi:hypothetical protein
MTASLKAVIPTEGCKAAPTRNLFWVLEPSKFFANQSGQVFKPFLDIKISANKELYGFWQ